MTESGTVSPQQILDCRGRKLTLGREPCIAGVLNVTPDSFSDGGSFAAPDSAVEQALKMAAEGAGMIDVGGQSTRPGHVEISVAEEIARVAPVIRWLADVVEVPISVDTYKPEVARAALEAGAHVLNDIHGLQRDPGMARIAAEYFCPIVVMHNDADFASAPGDVIERMLVWFDRSLSLAVEAGVDPGVVILDPGIGFGKTREQNLEILARLGELRAAGRPLLVGASRKSVIGNTLDLPVDQRLEGTLATTVLAVWQGVEIIRVHDVTPNLRAARMAAAIRDVQTTNLP